MLKVDPKRIGTCCGIPIRAELNGEHGTYDLAELTRESLLIWLSGNIALPTNTVLAMFEHDRLTDHEILNINTELKYD